MKSHMSAGDKQNVTIAKIKFLGRWFGPVCDRLGRLHPVFKGSHLEERTLKFPLQG